MTSGDGFDSDIEGFGVSGEGVRGAAVDVAGELVEEEDEGEGAVRVGGGAARAPGVVERGGRGARLVDERRELGADFGVEGWGGGEPLGVIVGVERGEPEVEDARDVGVHWRCGAAD